MSRSRGQEIGVGVLLIVAVALLSWMSVQVGALQGFGDRIQASAVLADAAGLAEGADVKVAGVTVGRVLTLTIDHDVAVVAFEVEEQAGLRSDAVAQVRARSVLGEKYLELSPQSRDAPPLADGDRLDTSRPGMEIDQLVNALGPMLSAANPDELQAIVSALHTAVADDPERLARMLANLDSIAADGAVAAKDLPAALGEARAAIREVRGLVRAVGPTVDRLDTLAVRLDEATTDLPETVTEVRGLVGETRAAVSDAQALLTTVSGSSDDLTAILSNLSEIDKWELRRLLREEGILVRLRQSEVVEP